MVLWWLFAVAFFLFALQYRENYTDPERAISRPELTKDGNIPSIWQSKIDANSPISSNDMDYFNALQAFYDKVYSKLPTRPKDTDVEAFLKTTDATTAGIDPIALRKMIGSSFTIEATQSAAARDQVYSRTEDEYIPVDKRKGELPEGIYAPTSQTEPSRPGEFVEGTSWTSAHPYSVCPCAENVL